MNVPINVFKNGVTDEAFSRSWEKRRTESGEGGHGKGERERKTDKDTTLDSDEEKEEDEDEEGGGDDDGEEVSHFVKGVLNRRKTSSKKEKKMSNDLSAEKQYMQSVLPSLKQKAAVATKGKKLSHKPRFQSVSKMTDFMNLKDKKLGATGFIATKKRVRHSVINDIKGGGMLTRSQSKRKGMNDDDNNDPISPLLPVRKRVKNQTKKTVTTNNGNVSDDQVIDVNPRDLKFIENEENKQRKKKDEENNVIDIRVGAILCLDDILMNHTDLTLNRVKENRARYLETLTFLKQLSTVDSHHLGVSYLICSQSILSSTGNSFVSDCIRTLRQNLDNYIVFGLQSSELRNLLTSISSGAQYQKVKQLFLRATVEGTQDTPSDTRIRRSYLAFSLNPTFVDKTLAFRLVTISFFCFFF